MIVGVISDTHGVLKAQARSALEGVEHILHAGDIGSSEVLAELNALAPVTAVRGNVDRDGWGRSLPAERMIRLSGTTFYILHDLGELDLDPAAAGIQVVVSGHTHQPAVESTGGVLYLNPGSASQRRRGGPLSVARILISDRGLQPRIIPLNGF